MKIENQILAELSSELEAIKIEDSERLRKLLRKSEVFVKRILGNETEYLQEIYSLTFVPQDYIYNTGHYKNTEAWEIGISRFKGILEKVLYEIEFAEKLDKESVKYPDKVSVSWLVKNVPIKIWLTLASLLVTVFLSGIAFEQSDFYESIKNKPNHEINRTEDTSAT